MKKFRNTIEFEVYGDYTLFTSPLSFLSNETVFYHIPTYEALHGITSNIYWKPTFVWIIDAVRVMNFIQTEIVGNQIYLKNVRYQVMAHFKWNNMRPDLMNDRNEHKHHNIALRYLDRGPRKEIYLGNQLCPAHIKKCNFGEGKSAYDVIPGQVAYDNTYHSIEYLNDISHHREMNVLFWKPIMAPGGVIKFIRPDQCSISKRISTTVIKSNSNWVYPIESTFESDSSDSAYEEEPTSISKAVEENQSDGKARKQNADSDLDFDGITNDYKNGQNINEIAKRYNLNPQKVTKLPPAKAGGFAHKWRA